MSQITPRRGEIDIERLLGRRVMSRLTEPFALVARWLKYVPLETLVQVHSIAMCSALRTDNQDGSVTMLWGAAYGIRPRVPWNLWSATRRYHDDTYEDRRIITPLSADKIFLVGSRKMTDRDFMLAVERALKGHKD